MEEKKREEAQEGRSPETEELGGLHKAHREMCCWDFSLLFSFSVGGEGEDWIIKKLLLFASGLMKSPSDPALADDDAMDGGSDDVFCPLCPSSFIRPPPPSLRLGFGGPRGITAPSATRGRGRPKDGGIDVSPICCPRSSLLFPGPGLEPQVPLLRPQEDQGLRAGRGRRHDRHAGAPGLFSVIVFGFLHIR